MRTYDEFHGRVPQKDIGKHLREIVKVEKKSFKIVTGYGSSSLRSQSKHAALSSLRRMVEEVLKVMKTLAQEGMTMVVVTHEIEFALNVATRVVFIDEGIIRFDGAPSQLKSTDDLRLKQFLNIANQR